MVNGTSIIYRNIKGIPGSSVVGTLHSHCQGFGFSSWTGNEILQATQRGPKGKGKKQKKIQQNIDHFCNVTKEPLDEVKEESEKADLKFNIQKTKIMASSLITSWQIDGEKMETVTDNFLGLQNHC